MANIIMKTNIVATNYVGPTSRYRNSKVYKYSENAFLTFETYKRKPQAKNSGDRWTTITSFYEYRPDKVSREIYGTPDFWWKILEYNNISDVFDFKAGLMIRLPSDIYS